MLTKYHEINNESASENPEKDDSIINLLLIFNQLRWGKSKKDFSDGIQSIKI